MTADRRKFITGSSLLLGGALLGHSGSASTPRQPESKPGRLRRISEATGPLAITMVDYSWMLKHHRYGAYEHHDRFFSELVERGYNAVRMDCFPHFIAADENGRIGEEFLHKKEDHRTLLWGHDFSIRSNPRKRLVEFLTKCREYGVHAGLATWFIDHGTDRSASFKGVDDFVRAWDETLSFIDEHGLMDVVTYVDLLNEYPLAHGLTWLDGKIDERSNVKLIEGKKPDANIPPAGIGGTNGRFNELQIGFYQSFMRDSIDKLKAKWPDLDRKHGVPVGNTEGWGAVFWEDNPTIDWRFIKESAEISVPLAVKHGYKFICTSNFTCPQFKGIWEDVPWHQKMTRMIKAG